jgi:hypothetical protein
MAFRKSRRVRRNLRRNLRKSRKNYRGGAELILPVRAQIFELMVAKPPKIREAFQYMNDIRSMYPNQLEQINMELNKLHKEIEDYNIRHS